MKNLLNEEISQIQYLFGYKKGVVISEQELGSAPSELFTYINGKKELSTDFLSGRGDIGKWVGPKVKKWCEDKATEGSVCVLGKGIDNQNERVKTMKLKAAIDLSKVDGYGVEKLAPVYIGAFEEEAGDGTKQTKYYYGAVYSKS